MQRLFSCYCTVLSVRLTLQVFDTHIDMFDGRHDCQGNVLDGGKQCPMSQMYRGELYDEQVFAFFCLNNLLVIS